jgi:hypothetical protein
MESPLTPERIVAARSFLAELESVAAECARGFYAGDELARRRDAKRQAVAAGAPPARASISTTAYAAIPLPSPV